ncbi:diguanylate cyclase [Fusibacter tunisiensis]|uniref:Diguanylate cyclase (GGDEF)-like protein/PAS domain S-box-containing protein n=1 Tax=Fusibacter tunisiensis TaxID=1008308 RepID=A0ABS2MTC7_9FIRM|nr:diguanylate cyclase (GGDEF)-like protein/PAS domain S-box-containing protein [Fusibacter tunisiensis]
MENQWLRVTVEELNRLGNLMASPAIVLNLDEVIYANDVFCNVTGFTLEEAKNMEFADVIDSNYSDLFLSSLQRLLEGKSLKGGQEVRLKTQTGKWMWFDFSSKRILVNDKLYLMVNLMEITEKKQIQIELSRSLKLSDAMLEVSQYVVQSENISGLYDMILKRAIDTIPNAQVGTVLLLDGHDLVVSAHKGFDDTTIQGFKIPLEESFLYRATQGKLDEIATVNDLFEAGDFLKVKTKGFAERYIRSTLSTPIYVEGQFIGCINVDSVKVNGFDDNDRKMMTFIKNQVEIAIYNHKLFEEHTFLAKYDSLTGLYNRYYFEEAFRNHKDYSMRYGTPFQVVLFDINDLKKVNDRYGHIVGDQLLIKYAEISRTSIRKSDLLARYGGDEFVGLFFESDGHALESRLEELLKSFEDHPLELEGAKVVVSFSYGISNFGEDGTELTTLLRAADKRMYAAKKKHGMRRC